MADHIPDPVRTREPNAPAIVWGGEIVSYGDLDDRVGKAESVITKLGLTGGDRLGLWYPHEEASPQAVVATVAAMVASWRLGVAVVPIGSRLPEKVVRSRVAKVLAEVVDPRELDGPTGGSSRTLQLPLDAPATIVHTSGSMGEPKAALLSMRNHVANARGWAERMPSSHADRWLLDLPLDHVGGIAVVVRSLLAGGCLVIPQPDESRVNVMRRFGVTLASGVELQLRRLVETETHPPDSLRMLLLGGGAVSEEVMRKARSRGWPVVPSYGLTEMASTVTALPVATPDEALLTAGSVLPGREVRIADDGEILVGGPMRFLGYVSAEGLDKPLDGRGFFQTGDLGQWVSVAGQRLLRVTGRRDNRFKSGGEQVVPEAIERELMAIQGVCRAVVVGVSHPEYGHRPVAFVDLDGINEADVRQRLQERLPRFMIPDRFLPWPDEGEHGLKPGRARLIDLALHSLA